MFNKVEVCVDADEWYPVYSLREVSDFWKPTGKIDIETYERWTRILQEFRDLQEELASFNCINVFGEHTFTTLPESQGSRTYCKNCHVDKGATPWI